MVNFINVIYLKQLQKTKNNGCAYMRSREREVVVREEGRMGPRKPGVRKILELELELERQSLGL
jgi:hypothetical protein